MTKAEVQQKLCSLPREEQLEIVRETWDELAPNVELHPTDKVLAMLASRLVASQEILAAERPQQLCLPIEVRGKALHINGAAVDDSMVIQQRRLVPDRKTARRVWALCRAR